MLDKPMGGMSKPSPDEVQNAEDKDVKEKNLKGLNGWLIFVLLGLLYALYSYASAAISSSKTFIDVPVERLSSVQGYVGVLGFEVVMQFILALATAFLIFLFFKKSKRFPKFYIIFLIIIVIYFIIDILMVSSLSFPAEIKAAIQKAIGEESGLLARNIISGIYWIWYMKVSKRVKLTFIE